jgi:probable phosphoglycerate mutase
MTTFLLIRHGAHDWLGKTLVGRNAGVPLNAEGRLQAEMLGEVLGGLRIEAVYSSPSERARETAAPLARRLAQTCMIDPYFDEIDFGRWVGKSFEELNGDFEWQQWNAHRATATGAGGERMATVQDRVVRGIERLHRLHAGSTVAVFSHGDVIKAALCYHQSLSLDVLQSVEISPGSVSVLVRRKASGEVALLNDDGREVASTIARLQLRGAPLPG